MTRARDLARRPTEWWRQLRWNVYIARPDGGRVIVAKFTDERDARGFAKARYGDTATVEEMCRRRSPFARVREMDDATIE